MTCESLGDGGEKEILFNSKRKKKKKAQGVIVGWTIRKETRKEQYQMQNESMSNTFIYLGGRAGPPNRIVDVLYIFLTGR